MAQQLEMTTKAEKFWDKQAKRYDRGEMEFAHVYSDIIAKTSLYLNVTDNVLDYGCATGTKTIELAGKVSHIHGIDISIEMIREANKKRDKANIDNISFSRGTIFEAGLDDASYDSIIAFGILHLLEDSDRVIRRINELLKPGGYFISTTACFKEQMTWQKSLEFKAYHYLKKLGAFPLHLNMFNTSDVKQLIEDHNFQIIVAEKLFSGISSVFIVARKS